MRLEIKLREGLDLLAFRCSTEKVRAVFGEPTETEELDNPCDESVESIVWTYENDGLIFFFDATEIEPVLSTIESDNIETLLFGKKVFQLNQQDIVALMKSEGYAEFEEEEETWGERRITFEEAQIDFYFVEDDLALVSWSCF